MLSWDVKTERDCLKGKCLVHSCHYWGLCPWGGCQVYCIGKFQKKTNHPAVVEFIPASLATALHLFWFFIMFHAGQAPLVPSLKHQGMVPSWWNILSQIPMHGYDWKRRPEREVLWHTLDLWRQFEGILQQEANSQGQTGPREEEQQRPLNKKSFIVTVPHLVKNPK